MSMAKPNLSAFEHLEHFLKRASEGVGGMKGMKMGDIPGKSWQQIKKTGGAMKEHPRAAIGGVAAGAAGSAAADRYLEDDDDEEAQRRQMMAYLRDR